MKPTTWKMLATAGLAVAAACAFADAAPPPADATAAVGRYLAEHGDFCLGKMDWPVDISALDERARGRDVVQMPVLESLGLVQATAASAMRVEGPGVDEGDPPRPVAVRRYALTPSGERFMREREVVVAGPQGEHVVRRRDLCAARLALDAVVDWQPAGAPDRFVATFTYVATPAPWAATPAFRRVFPMAVRVIDGAHAMRLKQGFRRVGDAWVADGLAD
ncbi:MAG: hypothetical protein ABJD97_07580 [Betaproteobacteria bacterium]